MNVSLTSAKRVLLDTIAGHDDQLGLERRQGHGNDTAMTSFSASPQNSCMASRAISSRMKIHTPPLAREILFLLKLLKLDILGTLHLKSEFQ